MKETEIQTFSGIEREGGISAESTAKNTRISHQRISSFE